MHCIKYIVSSPARRHLSYHLLKAYLSHIKKDQKIYVSLIDCHPQSCHLHFLLTRKLVLRAPYDVTLYYPIPVPDPSFLRQPWKAPSKLNPPFPNVTTVGLHRKARLYRRQRDRQIQCNPPSPISCSTPNNLRPLTDRLPQLTIRLCEGRFSPHHDVTIGVEFGSRIVNVGPSPASTSTDDSSKPPPQQKRMKLSLWDTAGQETYKSITRSYFRGASGALLVFDITRRSTFESATSWLHDLRQIAEEGIVVILVGNKTDLADASTVDKTEDTSARDHPTEGLDRPNNRAVTTAEAHAWCAQNDVLRYVETSAKSGEGVEQAFLEVAQKIYENVEKGRYDLNDRRSGVKGPGAGGGGGARATGSGGTVRLGMNDVVGKKEGGWGGGCC
jgi:Ras-related protein Rab-2A